MTGHRMVLTTDHVEYVVQTGKGPGAGFTNAYIPTFTITCECGRIAGPVLDQTLAHQWMVNHVEAGA